MHDFYYTIIYYDTVNSLDSISGFHRISGCPYEKKLAFRYTNKVPWFIKEHIPNPKRPDIYGILKEYDLDHYDEWELLLRSRGVSYSDRYFVSSSNKDFNYYNKWLHKDSLDLYSNNE
ncbi:MAG: hypothetical protein ACRC5M_07240 [Anaeroplasmataceae bacterium]